MFQTKKTRKTMKKTIWSLAALMLMAAPMMTSCSNDLDEVAPVEEAKGNVVTLTIALPEDEPTTRVAVNNSLKITGWENGDVVTLYKYNLVPGRHEEEYTFQVSEGVVFTYSNTIGEFSGTLPTGKTIDDYNLAIFGGTAENYDDHGGTTGIKINPTTWCSTELKNVVMMSAIKDNEGKFTMQVINNVMKIENQSGEDVTVAWYGYDWGPEINHFIEPASMLFLNYDGTIYWGGLRWNYRDLGWANSPQFTLQNEAVNYVNFPLIDGYENNDKIGLYKSDETAVVTMKGISGRVNGFGWTGSEWAVISFRGKLLNAGTYNGTAL